MTLKITDIQTHDDESNLLYTVTFDDFDHRCVLAGVTESAFFDPAAGEILLKKPVARLFLHSNKGA